MGMIQGSINNLLTTADVATRLSPELEAKAKMRGEAAGKKLYLKNLKEVGAGYVDEIAKVSEEIAKLDPTKDNIQAAYDASADAMFKDIAQEKEAKIQAKKAEEKQQSQAFKKEFMQGFEEIEKPSRAAVQKRLAEKKAAEALQMEQDRISRGGTV